MIELSNKVNEDVLCTPWPAGGAVALLACRYNATITCCTALPLYPSHYIHQASRPGENRLFLALRYALAVTIHQDVKFRQRDLFQTLCASRRAWKKACGEAQRESLTAATQPITREIADGLMQGEDGW